MRRSTVWVLALAAACSLPGCPSTAAGSTKETPANVVAELSFVGKQPDDDAFYSVTLDIVFTDPHGEKFRVPAFWAGGNEWRARYASPVVGVHSYRSECSATSDAGLHGVAGEVKVTPYSGSNPLYVHGPVRIAKDRRHFEYADGTPFFWLADTWWMGLCHRIHFPDEFARLAADRKEKGFNVVQIVAGLYPDMHPFDLRGANEAGYPWEKDYARIRPEYFDAADKRLQYLVDQGISPCIVGAWGYYMPWMGVEKTERHWRYLIARYGAMPVVWCAAGEANLPWYLAKGFPYDDREQVKQWTEVLRYIRVTDPFHRPLTIHPTGIGRLSARHATDDASLLDFDMLQTPHGAREALEPTARTVQESYADKPRMPVIDGEAAYEMLGDSLPTSATRQMFWVSMTNGAAGHTYGANGIWQCNRPGEPHGPSPHHNGGVGYGKIPWNQAMNLPGSRQVGLGKKLFERFDWWRFESHQEWVQSAAASNWRPHWGKWIWYPEGEPTKDAPVAKRYFRYAFDVHEAEAATLWLAVDDKFVAYLNGERIGANANWQAGAAPIDVTGKLRDGKNVLAVEAENAPGPAGANPAGLNASLLVETHVGERYEQIQSNGSWFATKDVGVASGAWTKPEFDASQWIPVKVLGPAGRLPWKVPAAPMDVGPFATGIPGEVRIIYSLPRSFESATPRNVCVRALELGVKYRATAFDPVTGKSTELGFVEGAKTRHSVFVENPAANSEDDWVLVLERTK